MITRTRWLLSLAFGLIIVVSALLVARNRAPTPSRQSASRPANGMAGMPGMSDMPGMTTPTNGTVALTAAQIRQLGVTFGTVEMRQLASETRASGTVTADESRIAKVTPKFGGFAERLYVNATGQQVRRGEALLEIYSPDLAAAQQELLLAAQLQRSLGTSAVPGVPSTRTDLVAAARHRLALLDISDAQIDEILRTGIPRRTFTLYAPSGGVVVEKNVVDGQSIAAGQTLYTLADLSNVWIDVQFRESDAALARVGAAASIDITGLPGRPMRGAVTYVYPTLDSTTRTVRARIAVSNTDAVLKPGMYAAVRLRSAGQTALTVPSSAVLRTGTRNVVFMDMGGGKLMPMEIEIGREAGEYTEVLSGLEPGQRVVTSAQFLLDSESNLATVMRSMLGQTGR